jgi:hypothetical protein
MINPSNCMEVIIEKQKGKEIREGKEDDKEIKPEFDVAVGYDEKDNRTSFLRNWSLTSCCR